MRRAVEWVTYLCLLGSLITLLPAIAGALVGDPDWLFVPGVLGWAGLVLLVLS